VVRDCLPAVALAKAGRKVVDWRIVGEKWLSYLRMVTYLSIPGI